MTPAKRKKLEQKIANTFVMLCALAGVMLADPWQMYRRGEIPVFISPNNLLELLFSIIVGLGVVAGVQEMGGDPDKKHTKERIIKRSIMAFISGAGARVMVG